MGGADIVPQRIRIFYGLSNIVFEKSSVTKQCPCEKFKPFKTENGNCFVIALFPDIPKDTRKTFASQLFVNSDMVYDYCLKF